jgi:ABC-type spermidine/putrescine transport system permease subunit II
MYTSVTTNTDPTIAAASAIILTVTTLLILRAAAGLRSRGQGLRPARSGQPS